MPLTRDELIQQKLGEIAGELKSIGRQNDTMSATLQMTQTLVQTISADMASVKAMQQATDERVTRNSNRIDKLEDRVSKQEVVAAKHGAGFGALAAAGTALIVEGIRQWLSR